MIRAAGIVLCAVMMVAGFPLPAVPSAHAAEEAPKEPPTIEKLIENLEPHDGLLTFHLDRAKGRVLLEVPVAEDADTGHRFLYVEGLLQGLGSNPVGLDRGQIGASRLVALRRVGGRILVEEVNTGYRALTDNPDERQAVRESFARSVLWAGEVMAEDEQRALVDFTSFLVRDAHGTARTLKRTGQGSFKLDPKRSAIDLDACLAFPDNLEFEALLTFGGTEPGSHVRETVPSPDSVTLIQHHSLLRLPDDGYRPRRFDPREGPFSVSFLDYAAPLDEPLRKQWIVRHRLEKVDPSAARSRVKEPIVYYLDRGVPEPMRSALLDGARWWAKAFEAAGFVDAYRVEMLPEGAHPLDARYNVIQWVHRSTRGWSYGGGVVDPRTGEMIKGHVSLGSLRVRQDTLLIQGLAGAAQLGSGAHDDPIKIALARIRQLSAHEVGHTLGLTHNFAASTYGRESVMDYPAPLVGITAGGDLDLSRAYAAGVGTWDIHAIRYAYTEFPPDADEDAQLEAIVQEGIEQGLLFLTDHDARSPGAAHPLANLWDNGADPVEALAHSMEVRRIALERFGKNVLPVGTPMALLHEALVPVYLHHRFQLDAAAKVVGGLDYRYSVLGDGQEPARFLGPVWQRQALETILTLLAPAALDIPESVLKQLVPRPFGHGRNRELFRGRAGPVFDPLGAAATAASMAVGSLLQPERAARLVDFHRRDPRQLGLEAVLDGLTAVVLERRSGDPRRAELGRVASRAVVDGLLELAVNGKASPGVRSRVEAALLSLLAQLRREPARDAAEAAHRGLLSGDIRRHLERRGAPEAGTAGAPEQPPGSPIGG